MSTKIAPPQWAKDCKKELIQREMRVGDLADGLGVSREYVSTIINGRRIAPEMAKRICEFLGVTYPEAG